MYLLKNMVTYSSMAYINYFERNKFIHGSWVFFTVIPKYHVDFIVGHNF